MLVSWVWKGTRLLSSKLARLDKRGGVGQGAGPRICKHNASIMGLEKIRTF